MLLSSSFILLGSSSDRFVGYLDSIIRSLAGGLLSRSQILVSLLIRELSDCILSGLGISLGLIYRCLLNLDFVSSRSSLDLRLCLLRSLLSSIGLINMLLSSSSVLLSSSGNRFISKRDSLIRSLGSSVFSFL